MKVEYPSFTLSENLSPCIVHQIPAHTLGVEYGKNSGKEISMAGKKGVIGILTGGGDVPGLNPAIRAVTIRALREGWQVIGIRRGWAGLVDVVRDKKADNSNNYQLLTEEVVNKA